MKKSSSKTLGDAVASSPAPAENLSTTSLAWLAPVSAAAAQRAPGELLVQFTEGAGAEGRAKALAAISGKSVEVLWNDGHGDNGALLLRVQLTGKLGIDKAIEMLTRQPGVKFAEANYIVGTQATSNDPQFTNNALWGMRGDTSGSTFGSAADEVWAAGFTGSSTTVVGVIDSGIDYRHPDLYLNIWLNQGEISATLRNALTDVDSDGLITFRDLNDNANSASVRDINTNGYIDAGDLLADSRWEDGIDNDGNALRDDLIGWDFANNDNDPLDDNRHGTHVAGTIGGVGGNGVGVAGVNWSTQMVALKFLGANGSGYTSNALKALDYYTNVSKVAAGDFVGTNNSWGGGGFSQSMLDAVGRTGAAGNLFVAAAGNGGSDQVGDNNDTLASYPSNYSTQGTLGWDAVVAVASMTSAGALSSFSNYGNTTVDLAAPGSSIMSTLPNGAYGYLSGTSMATPHVMGALALIASAMPDSTAQERLDILKQCVTYKADLAGKLAWDGWLDLGKLAELLAVDTSGPAVASLVLSDSALSGTETATVTITFSEAVTNFSKDDVVLSSAVGTLGEFTASEDLLSWSATLTPAADVEASGVKFSLAAGSYTSADGLRDGQAFMSSGFAVDTKAPTVGITLSDSQLTTGETARVTFSFSEAVTGFISDDIIAANGTISSLASTDGRIWTATFTPSASTQASLNSIAINADVYTDVAGNAGAAGSSANYTVDTTSPLPLFGTDGNDTLVGSSGADILNGVPAASTRFGRGSVDVLTGSAGNDVFVLGITGRVFYDDGSSRNLGTSDYARITDFTAGVDDLQLAGGRAYVFSSVSLGGSRGLGIYWDINNNGRLDSRSDEMIGMLVGANSIDSSDITLV